MTSLGRPREFVRERGQVSVQYGRILTAIYQTLSFVTYIVSVMTDTVTPSLFWRIGSWCARRAWIVIAAWLILVVAATLGSSALNASYNASFTLPGTPAQVGADLLKAHTPQASAAAANTSSGTIVFHVSSGSLTPDQSAIEAATKAVRALPTVKAVSDPFTVLAPNGRTAVASITYKDSVTSLTPSDAAATDSAVAPAKHAGVLVDYAGDLGTAAQSSGNTSSELVGIGVALLVLLFAFGSVLATLIPILSAVVGVFSGIGALGIVSAWVQFPSESPTIALMMGLGVGIDYALFLTTRFRQLVLDGEDPPRAAATTVASSGRAIVIAAVTVVIALVGLYASGIFYIGQLGVSAGIVVAVAAAAAVTLVPALLAIAGRRIDRVKVRRTPIAEPNGTGTGWNRYAIALHRHPVVYLSAAIALLAVLAIPLLSMQIGTPGVRALPTQSTARQASNAIDAGFGVGYQAALTIVVTVPSGQTPQQLQAIGTSLRHTLSTTPGIASATPFAPTADRALLIGRAIPTTSVSNTATASLIHRLDRTVLPEQLSASKARGYVTGAVATSLALQEAVSASLPLIILTVVAAAVLLMLLTFRSPLLALKAGLINLLSIGASYGVLVAVFQWGWGSQLLGIPQGVPIVSFVPMLMFAIIFGLSMDYEVFLLARVLEAWKRGASNRDSVASGLAVTGRIISCAAIIMACVFFSFILQPSVTIKMLAFGLGISVLIDATIVRLVIVPCAMYLFGKANWWSPRWLDRVLPHLEP